jgi:hypothetical protein
MLCSLLSLPGGLNCAGYNSVQLAFLLGEVVAWSCNSVVAPGSQPSKLRFRQSPIVSRPQGLDGSITGCLTGLPTTSMAGSYTLQIFNLASSSLRTASDPKAIPPKLAMDSLA